MNDYSNRGLIIQHFEDQAVELERQAARIRDLIALIPQRDIEYGRLSPMQVLNILTAGGAARRPQPIQWEYVVPLAARDDD